MRTVAGVVDTIAGEAVTEEQASGRWTLWSRSQAPSAPTLLRTPLWRREWDEDPRPPGPARPSVRPAGDPSPDPVPAGGIPAGGVRSAVPRGGSRVRRPDDLERLRRIVADRDVRVDFRPVCDVERGHVVGFEALPRGPRGPFAAPDRLAAAAAAAELAGELDWVCRAAAFRLVLDSGLPPAVSLFLPVEPESLIEPCPDDLLPAIWAGTADLRVFVELRGPALARYPFEALEAVRRVRAAGWGVAVGELERSGAGLALLPVLEPDVVAVGRAVLTDPDPASAAAVGAVLAEVEHAGAALLVRGVDTAQSARLGAALGARFHSGNVLGGPGPLPDRLPVPLAPVRRRAVEPAGPDTPWQLVADAGRVTTGVRPAELEQVLRLFAAQAGQAQPAPVVLAALPAAPAVHAAALAGCRDLLPRCPLVVVLGHGVGGFGDWPARSGELPDGSPLRDEGYLTALSPALALVVATRREPGPDGTVTVAVSRDPAVCRRVAGYLTATMDTLVGGVQHGAGVTRRGD
jgi:EAL domain-containing protein (putative c-di-GMP-specific phosphodiesterase class I)